MLKGQIIGHIGQDATVNEVNGQSVINFSVAHTEKWKDKTGREQEKTVWVDCAYWREPGKTGVSAYLKRGVQVYVEGQPEARIFTKRDGTTQAALSFKVSSLQLLGGGQSAPSSRANADPF